MSFSRIIDLVLKTDAPSGRALVEGLNNTDVRSAQQFVQGDTVTCRIWPRAETGNISTPLQTTRLAAGTVIVLAGKKADALGATTLLYSATDFTEHNTAVDNSGDWYYEATLNFNTGELAAAMTALSATATSLSTRNDVELQNADNTARLTYQFDASVLRQVYGGEADPTPGTPSYPMPSALVTKPDYSRGANGEAVAAVDGFVDANGRSVLGVDAGGNVVAPSISRRFEILESTLGTRPVMHLIVSKGQSNSQGAVSYSQLWRTPARWNDGASDGALLLTTERTGLTFTLNQGRSALLPLDGYGHRQGGEGFVHGMLDTLAEANPNKAYCWICDGTGGDSIGVIRKPTSGEIAAFALGIYPIPLDSAERGMTDPADILRWDYLQCATPYFKSLWLVARAKELAAWMGYRLVVSAATYSQGESDSPPATGGATAGWNTTLIQFREDWNADVQAITGQTEDIPWLMETMQSSTYNASEAARAGNQCFDLNLMQRAASLADPGIVYVAPRYPLTNLNHHHPHSSRAQGEYIAKAFARVSTGETWSPLHATSAVRSGGSIVITLDGNSGALQFATTTNIPTQTLKSGMARGFEWSGGALTEGQITISGNTVIITPGTAPSAGQTIKYASGVRGGTLCDSDPTVAKFTDRAAAPNFLRNYCIPFTFTLA